MLLTSLVPKAAAALSLYLNTCAITQVSAGRFRRGLRHGPSIRTEGLEGNLLYEVSHFSDVIDPLYGELFDDCVDDDAHNDEKLQSGIKFDLKNYANTDLYMKRRFITFYILSRTNPLEEIRRLAAADPTHERYEMLYGLLSRADCGMEWEDKFYENSLNVSAADVEKSRENWMEYKSRIVEFLLGKIEEVASMRTVEYIKGVFTADTAFKAFLQMLRRGKRSNRDFSYDDLSDVVAAALKSGDREETTKQFIEPLMGYALGLKQKTKTEHVLGCLQALRDGSKDIGEAEAKKLEAKMFDSRTLSLHLLRDDGANYFKLAVAMDIDPCDVTAYLNAVYHVYSDRSSEDPLGVLSAYYLDVLDADGQTRLKKVIDNADLIKGLPEKVLSRLLEDSTKLAADHPEEAEYLKQRLNVEPKP
ncbi:hypothetical protein PAPHI01_0679 [Pancytospora philotis]|nr:hypothetical protein PAPHI01_0679 [Pancytospora philotis]